MKKSEVYGGQGFWEGDKMGEEEEKRPWLKAQDPKEWREGFLLSYLYIEINLLTTFK